MDNPNPIRYSDLVTPDNAIINLIEQLTALIAKYEEAQSKIQGAATTAAQSIRALSGATEEQREQIKLTMAESEKLLKEYSDTRQTLNALNAKYNDSTLALKEFGKIQKLVDTINREQEGSYNRLSAQYRLNKIRLNELSEAQRKGTEAGRALEAETKAIYEQMNNLQLATGKAQLQVGHYEKALGGLLGVNPRIVSALTDTKQAAAAVGGVLKALAGPVGIAIGLIGALTAAFKLFKDSIHSTQQTGDQFDYAMGEWMGTWDVFKRSISTVDFSGFISSAREAAAAGRELKIVLDEAFERSNSARILRASMTEENAVLQETMRDSRKSYDERIAAGRKYLENMQPIYDQETETARRNAEARLEYLFSISNTVKYASKAERDAAKQRLADYIKEYNINEDTIKQAKLYLQAQTDLKAAEKALRSAEGAGTIEYYNTQKKLAQDRINSASAETKAMAQIVSQYNLTNNQAIQDYVDAEEKFLTAKGAAYNDQKRIVTMVNNLEAQQTNEAEANAKARAKAAENEAKAKKKAEEDAAKEAERARQKEIADQRAVLNAQLQTIQLQISATQEGTQEMLQLRLDMIAKQREIELFENEQKAEELRQKEADINAKYDALVLRETAKFNEEIAKRDLAAAQELAAAEFSLLDRNERQKTLFRLEQEKARLLAILKMNETATEKMTETEVAAMKATIAAIEKEAGRLGYNNLYELLGIGLDSDQQNALNTAIGTVKDSIKSLIDSWAKEADAAKKAADSRVDAAKKAVEAEIEARNAGYANSVETAQKELELAQKNQEKAAREQEKAQKAQARIDTLTQTSSLITASANIWKSLSGVPYVGPALAVAALATMWGSFAYSKVKAAQVTRQTEEYGEGTVELLRGGSHASGHDIDLGTKKDGTRRRAEGGEFFAIINKRNSRRYRDIIPDVINSLNDGSFADRYQRANKTMAGYAVGMIGGGTTDVSQLEKEVRQIREQGEKGQYTDGSGYVVVTYKNLTRKIKS